VRDDLEHRLGRSFGTMSQGTSKTITLSAKAPWCTYDCPNIYNTAVVSAENDASSSNNKSGPIKIDVDKDWW
jgi:hypothetical protein